MRNNSTGDLRGASNAPFNSFAAPDLRGLALVVVAGAWLTGILISSWVPLPSWILLLSAGVALIAVSAISTDNGTTWQAAHGQLEALTPGALIDNPYGPKYGDIVELQGKLQQPPPHSLPSIFASMAFPRISIKNAGGNPIIAALY